jgi:hypothetical protein
MNRGTKYDTQVRGRPVRGISEGPDFRGPARESRAIGRSLRNPSGAPLQSLGKNDEVLPSRTGIMQHPLRGTNPARRPIRLPAADATWTDQHSAGDPRRRARTSRDGAAHRVATIAKSVSCRPPHPRAGRRIPAGFGPNGDEVSPVLSCSGGEAPGGLSRRPPPTETTPIEPAGRGRAKVGAPCRSLPHATAAPAPSEGPNGLPAP